MCFVYGRSIMADLDYLLGAAGSGDISPTAACTLSGARPRGWLPRPWAGCRLIVMSGAEGIVHSPSSLFRAPAVRGRTRGVGPRRQNGQALNLIRSQLVLDDLLVG